MGLGSDRLQRKPDEHLSGEGAGPDFFAAAELGCPLVTELCFVGITPPRWFQPSLM